MNHAGITSGCATCHDDRQELHRRDGRQDQADEPPPDHRRLRELPRRGQVHQLRRHGDEPRRDHGRVRDLPRDRQELRRGDDGDPADAGPGPESPDYRRLLHLPHVDHLVQQRRHGRQASQPHSDGGGVRDLPHQPEQSGTGGNEPHRYHQWLRDLPRGECHRDRLHRCHAVAARNGTPPDDRRLRDLSQVDDELRRHVDEPQRHHRRLRDLPRHRQEFHRRHESQDQAGEPPPDHRRLRDLSRGGQFHKFRRHADESRRHHPAARPATRPGRASSG